MRQWLCFGNRHWDAELYNYFRDYDPRIGRYIESDPVGLQGGSNSFGYVGGDPLGFADPSGLSSSDKEFGIGDRAFWKWWEQNKYGYGPFDKSNEGFDPKKPFDIPNKGIADAMKEEYEQCKTRDSGKGGKTRDLRGLKIPRGGGRGSD